jgi:hypothetical protein
MEYGAKNKFQNGLITLNVVKVETQPKISIDSNTLCELHKCGVGLEINEKVRENIESH